MDRSPERDPSGRRREVGNVGRNVFETFMAGLNASGTGSAPELGKLVGGQQSAVFGEPVTVGPYTVIVASDVVTSGGSGPVGALTSPGRTLALALARGLGGGERVRSRPLAVIVLGPDGVQVRPVIDVSRIALAGIAASAAVGLAGLAAWRAVAASQARRLPLRRR